jgi:hypothetical protein
MQFDKQDSEIEKSAQPRPPVDRRGPAAPGQQVPVVRGIRPFPPQSERQGQDRNAILPETGKVTQIQSGSPARESKTATLAIEFLARLFGLVLFGFSAMRWFECSVLSGRVWAWVFFAATSALTLVCLRRLITFLQTDRSKRG